MGVHSWLMTSFILLSFFGRNKGLTSKPVLPLHCFRSPKISTRLTTASVIFPIPALLIHNPQCFFFLPPCPPPPFRFLLVSASLPSPPAFTFPPVTLNYPIHIQLLYFNLPLSSSIFSPLQLPDDLYLHFLKCLSFVLSMSAPNQNNFTSPNQHKVGEWNIPIATV